MPLPILDWPTNPLCIIVGPRVFRYHSRAPYGQAFFPTACGQEEHEVNTVSTGLSTPWSDVLETLVAGPDADGYWTLNDTKQPPGCRIRICLECLRECGVIS